MQVTLSTASFAETAVDLLVLAGGSDWKSGDVAQLDARVKGALSAEARRQRFKGTEGDLAVWQTHGALPCRYVVLAGVGNGSGPQAWYTLAHSAVTQSHAVSATSAAIAVSGERLAPVALEAIAEGVRLSSYRFRRLKSASRSDTIGPQRLALLVPHVSAPLRDALRRAETMAAATCYARDLINLPAAIATPTYLAAEARRIARAPGVRVRVLDAAAIKRAGFGALLGVAQGSAQPPRFIQHQRPAPDESGFHHEAAHHLRRAGPARPGLHLEDRSLDRRRTERRRAGRKLDP